MSNIKLEHFNRLTAKIDFNKIVDKYAEDCAKDLKRISPRGVRRSNTYAQGWTTRVIFSSDHGYGVEVWNATNYQLTHLLENGHQIVNKRGGVGWASAQPHIDIAYQNIKRPFERAMQKAKIDVEIE